MPLQALHVFISFSENYVRLLDLWLFFLSESFFLWDLFLTLFSIIHLCFFYNIDFPTALKTLPCEWEILTTLPHPFFKAIKPNSSVSLGEWAGRSRLQISFLLYNCFHWGMVFHKQWTVDERYLFMWWVWCGCGPGVLQFMGSQRVGHNWATELNWIHTSVLPSALEPPGKRKYLVKRGNLMGIVLT